MSGIITITGDHGEPQNPIAEDQSAGHEVQNAYTFAYLDATRRGEIIPPKEEIHVGVMSEARSLLADELTEEHSEYMENYLLREGNESFHTIFDRGNELIKEIFETKEGEIRGNRWAISTLTQLHFWESLLAAKVEKMINEDDIAMLTEIRIGINNSIENVLDRMDRRYANTLISALPQELEILKARYKILVPQFGEGRGTNPEITKEESLARQSVLNSYGAMIKLIAATHAPNRGTEPNPWASMDGLANQLEAIGAEFS